MRVGGRGLRRGIGRHTRLMMAEVMRVDWRVACGAAVGGAVLTLALATLVSALLPKSVQLSYAGDTCAGEPTLMPAWHDVARGVGYDVTFTDTVELAGITLLSKKTCFAPSQPPEPGEVTLATSPWGGWLMRQYFVIVNERQPTADVSVLAQPIPSTKPLGLPIDIPDVLHEYVLTVDDVRTQCEMRGDALECDITTLQLDQGASYTFELAQLFDGEVRQRQAGTLETLRAVTIVEASVQPDQTIYDKPQSFHLTADKPLKTAKAVLKKDDEKITTEVMVNDASIEISFEAELERRSSYTLAIDSLEADDGSTLVDAHKTTFYVSDGPLVKGVSIGGARVGLHDTVIVTFDQPVAEQNLAQFVSVQGVPAAVARHSPTQIAVRLAASERCKPFTIGVAKGLISEHGVASTQDWSHTSRTICHTTSVYGTSVQGRALVAYHFGNSGPVTMYVGAIHGNESSSMGILNAWINELEANPGRIGSRQIVVIPNVNPDGIAAGTRANANRVNLNRNFPTSNWVSDIRDTDGTHTGGGGSSPLSEPEARALAAITSRYKPRLLLSYHAIGSLVVGDPGGYSAGKAAQYASLVGYRNATGMSATFDYDVTGAYEDWTYRNVGIPSMIIELGSYTYHNFSHHRNAFWAMLD